LEQARETHARAEGERMACLSHLTLDGDEDPRAALSVAQACAESAESAHKAAETKAAAIKLLAEFFTEEQQTLSEQFTQPLQERVARYLQLIFGKGVHVKLELKEEGFEGLQIVRPAGEAGAFDFESLSGGAREQLAAAVRLSVAELLAEDHEGCLPVVFDDAFAYSDSERLAGLIRMLDYAAQNGLQVIVLTCNPNDYGTLGAKPVDLSQPVAESGPLATSA
jgi:uncharacterized protein YhaN